MKRGFLLLLLLSPIFGVVASDEVRLRDLIHAMRELGNYEVAFEMEVNGERMDFVGLYEVDGERYSLSMPEQMIVGDSAVRYTIDRVNQEVVVERVDAAVPMVISNPARAFTMLDQAFSVSLKFTGAEYYTLWLRPKKSDPILRIAELQISSATHLPMSIFYTSHEGDRVGLYLDMSSRSRAGLESTIPPLDTTLYPSGYEVIDFR